MLCYLKFLLLTYSEFPRFTERGLGCLVDCYQSDRRNVVVEEGVIKVGRAKVLGMRTESSSVSSETSEKDVCETSTSVPSSKHTDNSSCSELSEDDTPLLHRLATSKRVFSPCERIPSKEPKPKKIGFVIPRKKRQKKGKNLLKKRNAFRWRSSTWQASFVEGCQFLWDIHVIYWNGV